MENKWEALEDNFYLDLPEGLTDKLLAMRGIKNPDDFLNPDDTYMLPLGDLSNIVKASHAIINGIRQKNNFHILFDVDTDGACAGAMIYRYLKKFTDDVTWSVNKGKIHGIKSSDVELLKGNIDILIMVDSSSEKIEEHKALRDSGIIPIVLDHHISNKKSPYAIVVNSQFDGYKNPALSGAGVTFKTILCIDKMMGTDYAQEYWDLACVGIIADVMDLSENSMENRYICKMGFLNLKNRGLKDIIGSYGFDGKSVGYSIAPLINSAMRMGENETACSLLLMDKSKTCKEIIASLKLLKKEQDEQKKRAVSELVRQIEVEGLDNNKVIGVFKDDTDKYDDDETVAEISGLVANNLIELYKRPVMVLHSKNEYYRGSMRGYGVDDFRSILLSTGLVEECQGHKNASGVTIKKENYKTLINTLNSMLKNTEFVKVSVADIVLSPNEITFDLIKALDYINLITGNGFSQVTIIMKDIEINDLTTMLDDKHLKWEFNDIDFIIWNCTKEDIDSLSPEEGMYKICNVLGTLQIGNFKGKRRQFIVNDYKDVRDNFVFLKP